MDLVFNGPLFRSFIGYDDIFRDVERLLNTKNNTDSYPPYNVWSVKPANDSTVAETTYIELAVAGFKKCELAVNLEDGVLSIAGEKQNGDPAAASNGYRGIARRNFVRKFRIGEKHVVSSAKLEDGMLTIKVDLPMKKKLETRVEIQ